VSGVSNAPRPRASKKPHPRFVPRRNFAPTVTQRPPKDTNKKTEPAPEPPLSAAKQLLWTAGGAAGASVVGAFVARWGLSPEAVAGGITAGATIFAAATNKPKLHAIATGMASAGGSQLMLMLVGPSLAPKPAAAVQAPKPTTVVIANQNPPAHKNADLGSLPPGMLHSSFERARAELAIADQVHEPYGFAEHHHHAA
jgi:hypothetical protein